MGKNRKKLPQLLPSVLETAHRILLDAGGEDKEKAAEELRILCLDTKAKMPHLINRYIEMRRADEVMDFVDKWIKRGDKAKGSISLSADDRAGADEFGPRHYELDAETLLRLNEFLLERQHILRAYRLKRASAQGDRGVDDKNKKEVKAQPRSWFSYLSPLAIGVPAGTLLVLDVGTAWNEVIFAGKEWAFRGTITLSLLLAFFTLVGGLARRTAGDVREAGVLGWGKWIWQMVKRSLPVFVGSWALAFLCSSLVLISLAGTSTTGTYINLLTLGKQSLLWSSLSLFLGIFLGLIAQGRGLYDTKASAGDDGRQSY